MKSKPKKKPRERQLWVNDCGYLYIFDEVPFPSQRTALLPIIVREVLPRKKVRK